MAKVDGSKLTEEAIEAAWKDLGNGTKVKEKLTKQMDEKLDSLVAAAKAGNWKAQLEEAIVQMITHNTISMYRYCRGRFLQYSRFCMG